jgi:hypothetical protein
MTQIHPENLSVLENSLALAIGEDFSLENDPDVIQQLIGDKRSPNTKREATQRFSRHAQVQTVLKYDDNRQRLQKQMSDSISELI